MSIVAKWLDGLIIYLYSTYIVLRYRTQGIDANKDMSSTSVLTFPRADCELYVTSVRPSNTRVNCHYTHLSQTTASSHLHCPSTTAKDIALNAWTPEMWTCSRINNGNQSAEGCRSRTRTQLSDLMKSRSHTDVKWEAQDRTGWRVINLLVTAEDYRHRENHSKELYWQRSRVCVWRTDSMTTVCSTSDGLTELQCS